MRRLKEYLLCFLIVIFCQVTAWGQTGVKGILTDAYKQTMPGVAIAVKGTAMGTVTKEDGSFEIDSLEAGTRELEISYVGYDKMLLSVAIVKDAILDIGKIVLKNTGTSLNEVKVSGSYIAGSESKAISMTKNSDKTITVLSAENISKMPDKNAADAAQRAAGITVLKNKGEGSEVSLRGTPFDWTATLLNGNRMPTADETEASRVFDFDVFPSSLIDYIVITRTVTPDIEGDNIGGAINFITKAGVTQKTLQVDLAGGYSILANKPLVNGNLLWGNISKNKKFSYVVNASYYDRNYAADAPVIAYGSNENHSIDRLELKKYEGERKTMAANIGATYQPTDNLKIEARLLGSRMTDDKYQQKMMFNWFDPDGPRVKLQNIHGLLDHDLYSGQVDATWKVSRKWTIKGEVTSSYNRFQYGPFPYGNGDPRNGYTTVEFNSPLLQYTDLINTNFFGGKYNPNNVKDPNPYPNKLLGIDNPYGTGGVTYKNLHPTYAGNQLTPGDFYLDHAFADQNTTWEQDPLVAQLSGDYKLSNKVTITVGAKYRMKEGSRDISYYEWYLAPGAPKVPLTNFQTTSYGLNSNYLKEWGNPYSGSFMPFLTQNQLQNFLTQNAGYFKGKAMDTANNEYVSYVGDHYTYTENVAAGYIMANVQASPKLSFVGGLRVEETMLSEQGDSLIDDKTGKSTIGKIEVPVSINRTYTAILPALNALYRATDNDNIRAAISRTFHRPNFEETKPGAPVYDREDYLKIYGNPDLKPTYSLNLDLGYEHYWGSKGMWSLGGYYKYVTDHIIEKVEADEINEDGTITNGFLNSSNSYILGAEAMIERKFDFLPGFLKGFGVNANVTCSYSRMQVPGRPQMQPMTEQAPLIYNIALFYEYNKIETRLGLNYTASYITELNLTPDPNNLQQALHTSTDFDVFMGQSYSLDFQFSYKFNKNFSGYIELNNLLDSPYYTYVGTPDRRLRTEYYGRRGMIGIKFDL